MSPPLDLGLKWKQPGKEMLSLQLLYLKNNICKIKAKPFCVNSSTEFQLRNAKPVWLLFSISAGLLHVFFKWLLLQNRLISCTGCFSLTFCRALLYEASDDSEFNTWPFAYGCAAAARAMGRMAMETAAWRSHRGNRARDSAAHPATHCLPAGTRCQVHRDTHRGHC